jgi:hypothetical protein
LDLHIFGTLDLLDAITLATVYNAPPFMGTRTGISTRIKRFKWICRHWNV